MRAGAHDLVLPMFVLVRPATVVHCLAEPARLEPGVHLHFTAVGALFEGRLAECRAKRLHLRPHLLRIGVVANHALHAKRGPTLHARCRMRYAIWLRSPCTPGQFACRAFESPHPSPPARTPPGLFKHSRIVVSHIDVATAFAASYEAIDASRMERRSNARAPTYVAAFQRVCALHAAHRAPASL